ncbi:MAG: transposase family protein, partial [Treponema sp.]|nr:transposase family protein [Treponema sp.]
MFGLLSGIKDIEHIAEWAEEAEESIKALVKFEFGPPSADTILRFFRNVNADKIENVFIKWAHGIYKKVKIESDRKIVVMAREERTVNGKTSTDIRFFLTSLDNIELVKKSIRLHWGIENRQFRLQCHILFPLLTVFSLL